MTNNANAITVFDSTIFTALADHLNEGRQNPMVFTMREMMSQLMGEEALESIPEEPVQVIVTNEARYFGAVNIYSEDCIKQVQEKLHANNFYVLPSSKHEVICVPTEGMEIDVLLEMVTDINQTQVMKEDRLGNFVLYYDGDTRQLVKVAGKKGVSEMRVEQLMDMLAQPVYTVIIVNENGYEEDYEDWDMDEVTRDYINGIRFEAFDIFEQDDCRILKIWL